MPSELQQSGANLDQPWKKWYPDLKKAGGLGSEGTPGIPTANSELAQPKQHRGGVDHMMIRAPGQQQSPVGGRNHTSSQLRGQSSGGQGGQVGQGGQGGSGGGSGGKGNHGTVALERKLVDLEAPKKKPTIKVCALLQRSIRLSKANFGVSY
ncbi:hypothetical protein PG993_013192 [Apiospora rasikravindrae]|uniref:Uncharacterized protein n=1 Tax=Apiospora rasikravindrae TaxID=990691 RepID=A0ABR1RWY2_9PEZI